MVSLAEPFFKEGYKGPFVLPEPITEGLLFIPPPYLPLPKGGITPLWKRGERGDFIDDVNSILRTFIIMRRFFFGWKGRGGEGFPPPLQEMIWNSEYQLCLVRKMLPKAEMMGTDLKVTWLQQGYLL